MKEDGCGVVVVVGGGGGRGRGGLRPCPPCKNT